MNWFSDDTRYAMLMVYNVGGEVKCTLRLQNWLLSKDYAFLMQVGDGNGKGVGVGKC